MRHCTLYLDDIRTKEELHVRLKGALMLPDYYGRNLDALEDCLTDIREDIRINIHGFSSMKECISGYSDAFRETMEDICKEDPHICVTFID